MDFGCSSSNLDGLAYIYTGSCISIWLSQWRVSKFLRIPNLSFKLLEVSWSPFTTRKYFYLLLFIIKSFYYIFSGAKGRLKNSPPNCNRRLSFSSFGVFMSKGQPPKIILSCEKATLNLGGLGFLHVYSTKKSKKIFSHFSITI